MSAKIRTIKASSVSEGELFEFNKTINYKGYLNRFLEPPSYKGERLGALELKEKKSGRFQVKVFQDLNGDGEITKSDLIFKGKTKNVEDPDDLMNFVGSIKLKKQMHYCDWEQQKPKYWTDILVCTMDEVPTVYDFTIKSATTGEKYSFDGIGDFKSEFILTPGNFPGGECLTADLTCDPDYA